MLNKKLDLRIDLLTFTLNNRNSLKRDLLEEYFKNASNNTNDIIQLICKNFRNFDEVNLLINKYYKINLEEFKEIHEYNQELFAFKYLQILSKVFLSSRDGNVILKYWKSENSELLGEYNDINKIAMWNSIIRKIHPTFMVIQYLIKNKLYDERYVEVCNRQVKIEDLQLERILQKGVAETHIHINAGINFDIKWNDLMNSDIKESTLREAFILSNKEITREEAIKYIYVAKSIRIILAKYIVIFSSVPQCEKLYEYYRNVDEDLENDYNKTYFSKIIDEIANGNFKYIGEDTLRKCEYLINNSCEDIKRKSNDFFARTSLNEKDILRKVFIGYEGVDLLLENIFIFRAFKMVNNYKYKEEDAYFVKLLYKYVVIKNLIYKSIVSDNSIKGLDKFTCNFKESTKLDLLKKEQLELAIENQMESDNLRKIEIRVGISNVENDWKLERGILDNLRIFFETYKRIIDRYKIEFDENDSENQCYKYNKKCLPLIGVIYHFTKRKDDIEKCWLHGLGCDKLYYEKIRNRYLNQIQIIKKLRESIPYLSNYIIGIDAASIEFNTDPWVFAPVFKLARNGENDILFNKNNGMKDKIKNLGFTFHVGEDFRHILSGFRNIYEVVEYLNFRAGDRIGHGIALGVEVESWVEENNVVIIPRIEYLENLLWMWDMLTSSKKIIDYDINGIERKILEVAFEIFGDKRIITVNMLYASYKQKFELYKKSFDKDNNNDLDCIFDYDGEEKILEDDSVDCYSKRCSLTGYWDYIKLLKAGSCSKYLKKMKEPIEVRVENVDVYIIKSLQEMLVDLIIEKGIVVETNPTSNRVIGQINNIFNHYISNLNNDNKEKNVIVSINTDDPSVFNTNINNEFAYIFYSLLHKGYDRSSALEWIDNIRVNGMESSFIRGENKSIAAIVNEIDEIIEKITEMY